MTHLEGKGQLLRRKVSFGPCKYSLPESVKQTAGRGIVTLLKPEFLPPPECPKGYVLELDDGTTLECELWEDLGQTVGGSIHSYAVRCWRE